MTLGTFAHRLTLLTGLAGDLPWRELDRLARLGEGHAAQIAAGLKARPTFETADALAGVLGAKALWLLKGEGAAPSERTVRAAVRAARETAIEKAKASERPGGGAAHPAKVRGRSKPASGPRAQSGISKGPARSAARRAGA